MAWVRTGAVDDLSSGILKVSAGPVVAHGAMNGMGSALVCPISDSRIGSDKPANTDVTATCARHREDQGYPDRGVLFFHTRDRNPCLEAAESTRSSRCCPNCRAGLPDVPGEHHVLEDDGKHWSDSKGRIAPGGTASTGQDGVDFIGLVIVVNLKAGAAARLNEARMAEYDVRHSMSSAPIVRLRHPLWSVYSIGMGGRTIATRALVGIFKRVCGSVLRPDSHIHQVIQKVEGHVTFTPPCRRIPRPARRGGVSAGR